MENTHSHNKKRWNKIPHMKLISDLRWTYVSYLFDSPLLNFYYHFISASIQNNQTSSDLRTISTNYYTCKLFAAPVHKCVFLVYTQKVQRTAGNIRMVGTAWKGRYIIRR